MNPYPSAEMETPTSALHWQHDTSNHTDGGSFDGKDGGGHDGHGHIAHRRGFRRPRAGRACGTCHSRRVRCDAGSRGLPCTNCEAFSLPCSIPPKKKKKREGETVNNLKRVNQRGRSIRHDEADIAAPHEPLEATPHDFASLILQADEHIKQQPDMAPQYATLVNKEVVGLPIDDPGRVAYLQEFSNLSLIVHDYDEPASGGVHYPLPKIDNDSIELSTKMNQIELQILNDRGALSLPPQDLCDELVNAYFKWIAPVVPIINHTRFMQQYRDPHNPPSILLMQAILLAGSRVCTTEMLLDSNGSPIPAATLFYKRAKALYDADYEQDRVTIVQALILMGWYWEEPGKVTKNVFYWNGLAVTIAHGFGMHRNPKNSKLSTSDKKLWKRIWWTLFTRDRAVAVALGRPPHINMRDSDMDMIREDDFVEDNNVSAHTLHTQFFLQYVKICEIMDLVLLQNYSISAKARNHNAMALTQCDMALADWIRKCPRELKWDPSRYNFWSAYLHSIYQTTICLLHRAHLPPAPSPAIFTSLSRSPAFQSARVITSIVECLMSHNELRYTPPFTIYTLMSTMIVQIYQLYISVPSASREQIKRISICMEALEKVSDIWLVAKAVQGLFETVLSSAGYEKTLNTASGPIYRKIINPSPTVKRETTSGNAKPSTSSKESSKSMPLTPALRTWADVALKSAATPETLAKSPPIEKLPGKRSTSSKDTEPQLLAFSTHWKDFPQQPLAQYPPPPPPAFAPVSAPALAIQDPGLVFEPMYNYLPEEQNIAWNPQWVEGTPAPTGFNAAEWFQFFGIQ